MMDNNGNSFNRQSPAFDAYGGFVNFQNQFNQFQQALAMQMDPNAIASYAEAKVREGLQNGSISQARFNEAAMMVNQMFGR